MPIIRHRYTKLDAEITNPNIGKVEIGSSIRFVDVQPQESLDGKSSAGFTIIYEFATRYGGDQAHTSVRGEVLYVAAQSEADEIVEAWEKNKTLPDGTMLQVGNYCLMRGQMQAISLANGLDIQSPVRLPSFELKRATEKKE